MVTSLSSSCGAAQLSMESLLESHGYQYLYWSILCYLTESCTPQDVSTLHLDVRNSPILCFEVAPSLKFGRCSTSGAAAASPILRVSPFASNPTHRMVAVEMSEDGERWFGRPLLLFVLSTYGGQRHELAYVQWLTPPLAGEERAKMPLPNKFPLHQWEKSLMGLPLPGRAHEPSHSFGVVDVSKILNVEPIVQIGLRQWRPTSRYLCAMERQGRSGASRGSNSAEVPPAGTGEPLFANNIHVWSCGTGDSR